MALGATPRPSRVPEQRLLSLELRLRWRQRCGTFYGWMPTHLGFSHWREFIGGRAMSEGTQGAHTMAWRGQGAPVPPGGVATSVPSSVFALDSVFVSGK
jgi:hypothetical protein